MLGATFAAIPRVSHARPPSFIQRKKKARRNQAQKPANVPARKENPLTTSATAPSSLQTYNSTWQQDLAETGVTITPAPPVEPKIELQEPSVQYDDDIQKLVDEVFDEEKMVVETLTESKEDDAVYKLATEIESLGKIKLCFEGSKKKIFWRLLENYYLSVLITDGFCFAILITLHISFFFLL